MTLNRRSIALVGALGIAAAALISVAAASATPGDPEDPATTAQPQYDYDNPGKSFLVKLQFNTTSAALIDATVGENLSYSHLGDPPLLRLSLTDEDSAPVGTFNAWDPRWITEETPGNGERLTIQEGPGTLTLPFDADTASLLVHDVPTGIDLATVDLRPAVHEFCLAHPDDPDCVKANLAVTSATATGDPLGVVGQPVALQVKAVAENLGPDGPVDAIVTQTASSTAGVTLVPSSRTFDTHGLAVGSPATILGDYDVTCTAPGMQSVTVTTSIVPVKAKVADLDATNNTKTVTFNVDCAVPVTLNVMPGSVKNPVNVNPGVLPMAVLTTAAGQYGNPFAFDAATIQAATVRVGVRGPLVATGIGAPEAHGAVHLEDSFELDERTKDGDLDAVLHARQNQLGIQPATTEICVRGRFGPGVGTTFFGCDHITLVPR
ncbi:MAG: hypothetical protein ACRDS0_14960 [Pseudonocardiaceae bacterium]